MLAKYFLFYLLEETINIVNRYTVNRYICVSIMGKKNQRIFLLKYLPSHFGFIVKSMQEEHKLSYFILIKDFVMFDKHKTCGFVHKHR